MNAWTAVDLDGTLAEYHGFEGATRIGPPIPKMVARVQQWLAEGREVKIFTARVDGGVKATLMGDPHGEEFRDVATVRQAIEAWCLQHIGQVLEVTNSKDYGMEELYDDRAVQVEMNTGEIVGYSTRNQH